MAKDYGSRREAVEHLYRRIADGAAREELLEIVYDAFGANYDLRPPVLEIRVARLCGTENRADA